MQAEGFIADLQSNPFSAQKPQKKGEEMRKTK
jgi:hypothetical protein